jgi:hypothetical protein
VSVREGWSNVPTVIVDEDGVDVGVEVDETGAVGVYAVDVGAAAVESSDERLA